MRVQGQAKPISSQPTARSVVPAWATLWNPMFRCLGDHLLTHHKAERRSC